MAGATITPQSYHYHHLRWGTVVVPDRDKYSSHHTSPHHTGNTRNYDGVWCPLAAIKSVLLIPVCVRDLNYNGGNWAGKLENINQIASRIIISPFLSDLIWLLGEGSAREGNYNVNLSAEIINSSSKLTGWL